MATTYALSLKQPWATLLVHGRKTIEVRRWPTRLRGLVLIHAARVPDPRPEAWAHVPRELAEHALLGGGLVGAGTLTGCVTYSTPAAFVADQQRHLNEPSWFQPPALYGFTFTDLTTRPYRRLPGNVRFFQVEEPDPA